MVDFIRLVVSESLFALIFTIFLFSARKAYVYRDKAFLFLIYSFCIGYSFYSMIFCIGHLNG